MLLPEDRQLTKNPVSAPFHPLNTGSPRATHHNYSSSADAETARETRRAQSQVVTSKKVSPAPTKSHNSFADSETARETRRAQSPLVTPQKVSPAPGSAADLPTARAALRRAQEELGSITGMNRGGLRAEADDLRRDRSMATARLKSAEADKALKDAKALPPSLNRGGLRQDAIKESGLEVSRARTAYLSSQGLDSSGRPFKLTPPTAPEPHKSEKKSWWDEHKGIVHGALDVAGLIPGLGTVADLTSAGIYLAEGDKANAALSAIAAVPGVGDAVAATAIGAKVAIRATKATKGIEVSIGSARGVKGVEEGTEALPTAVGSISRKNKNNVPFRNSQTFRSLLKDLKIDPSKVVAGHGHASSSGRREMLGMEDQALNQVRKTETRRFIDHKGSPLEVETAKKHELTGAIPKGTVGSARSHPGWTRSVKINPRGIDVVESRFDKNQVLRLKEISRAQLGKDISQAKLRGESVRAERLQEKLNEDISQAKLRGETSQSKPINQLSSKDRNLYEHYLQSLRDSAPRSRTGGTPSHLDFEQPRGQYNLRAPRS